MYRKYPDAIKRAVIKAGDVDLFPELKIPRATAEHWIKKSKSNISVIEVTAAERANERRFERLEIELEKERALRALLEFIRKIYPLDFKTKHVGDQTIRKAVVEAVRRCMIYHKLSVCLRAIRLSETTFYRWSSEFNPCPLTKSRCQRRHKKQLTENEINQMKFFITSKKYAHVTIGGLCLLAQRAGLLFSSLHTWYKYRKHFGWLRPWTIKKKKFYRTGVRAKQINEIWHIDVTVFILSPGKKLYIQVVYDNYSRFVVAFRVTDAINAESTVETLKLAHANAKKFSNSQSETQIMMDPGSENRNGPVLTFIESENLKRVLARVDIAESNSMIETLFRSLKNNYLYHQGMRTIHDLERKARFYFTQHNDVIPQFRHGGATPSEIYKMTWTAKTAETLAQQREEAVTLRESSSRLKNCPGCNGTMRETHVPAEIFGQAYTQI